MTSTLLQMLSIVFWVDEVDYNGKVNETQSFFLIEKQFIGGCGQINRSL